MLTAAALSGFIGALAGGAVALISQILSRKWQKEDKILENKRILYSKKSAVGCNYTEEEIFKELNANVTTALLLAKRELRMKLVKYVASIEELNEQLDIETNEIERKRLIDKNTPLNVRLHREMGELMRKELGVRD